MPNKQCQEESNQHIVRIVHTACNQRKDAWYRIGPNNHLQRFVRAKAIPQQSHQQEVNRVTTEH
ncbi:hypothetical protein D3C80_1973300 [compost metagenome]